MFDGIKRFIARLVTSADLVLCAEEDAFARARGWQITKTGFGSRSYRDPRFDLLKVAAAPDGRSIGVDLTTGKLVEICEGR
ncbi:hypothetical protein [Nonomuraea dietziae]|uniref:hypothetical protein n=1 Tax=Nonomuraea dietziae TaxID=65515 RepID=UPI0033F87E41